MRLESMPDGMRISHERKGARMPSSRDLVLRIDQALAEVDRASPERWTQLDGSPAAANLALLRSQLSDARAAAQEGRSPGSELSGLVRWVSDWIPDLDDPLIPALSRVCRHND